MSLTQLLVPSYRNMLRTLSGLLEKAERQMADRTDELLSARLAADMRAASTGVSGSDSIETTLSLMWSSTQMSSASRATSWKGSRMVKFSISCFVRAAIVPPSNNGDGR